MTRMRLGASAVLAVILALASASPTRAQARDAGALASLVGVSFDAAVARLDEWNQILIRNTERLAPAQAAEIRARTRPPKSIPEGGTLALGDSNLGLGLVTFLFEEDFVVEQVNLIFCDERVATVQMLFDDSRTFGDTVQLLSRVHGMGPTVPFGSHQPALRYPLPGVEYDDEGRWTLAVGAEPATVWDMGPREAVYQPIPGQRLITGQFWLTSKLAASECAEDEGRLRRIE